MIFNPELRRNIWLECTSHRMIITPIIIACILVLSYKGFNLKAAAGLAFYIAMFFMFIWGTKRASECITDETNNNTWDFQRLSTISPWKMTIGKLFGSTIYTWYGALLALVPYIHFSLNLNSESKLWLKVSVLILGAILCHSLAVITTLEATKFNRNKKTRSFKYFFLALIIGSFYTSSTLSSINSNYSTINWHSQQFDSVSFYLSSLAIFVVWSIIGIYRSMRKELQYKNIPWVWGIFSLYCIFYFSGFVNLNNLPFFMHYDMIEILPNEEKSTIQTFQELVNHSSLFAAFFIGAILTYISIFTEKLDTVSYQKLIDKIKKQNIFKALHRLPRWPISFALTIATGIWIISSLDSSKFSGEFSPAIFIVTCVFLLFRDIGIAHFFQFSSNPSRANLTSFLYIAVLYILIPGTLSVFNLNSFAALFLPGTEHKIMSLYGTFIQAVIVSMLVFKRLSKRAWL